MRLSFLILAFAAGSASVCCAATLLSDPSGLTIDTFPNGPAGTSFTDSSGNVIMLGMLTSSTIVNGIWDGAGGITVTLASPVTAIGFSFGNLCFGCTNNFLPGQTVFDAVTLNNGDNSGVVISIPGGSSVPRTIFAGISSSTPFTKATFHEPPFNSFVLFDFRFGNAAVPEPAAVGLIAPALLAIFGLKLRRRCNDRRS